ncbi:hypothetical protein CROQUDRAFT_93844 [Cronartium quercuum f. sp. fusiforme G11]|uniref:Uncharacterized protein n=1 Tax=Cronartium quercuum f. sp. fusiforme G11 TaxID=708437 RepID=A0A9P6TB81_9BASI|nr:hypothetical protein CROQUDRAFT_93844 [Cronartium quercuum f. sp. fusiforme G11]
MSNSGDSGGSTESDPSTDSEWSDASPTGFKLLGLVVECAQDLLSTLATKNLNSLQNLQKERLVLFWCPDDVVLARGLLIIV